jgi:Transglycosylase SLT domain
VSTQLAASGIPARALQAYKQAAVEAGCGLPWTLVAAIGRVESNHGQFGGARLLSDGRSDPPIIGIPLDGRPGVAEIKDTDHGRWDRDTTWDRAVGPMQFIPSSWATFGLDGDRNGTADPFDIDDAAASAAKYLCRAGGGDLSGVASQRNAVYSYNRSTAYVDTVMALAAVYAGGAPIDGSPAPNGTPIAPPTLPPGSVGPPPAADIPTTPPAPGQPAPTPTTPAPRSTGPAPTTTNPSSPAPTTQPSSPAPTTTDPGTPTPTGSPTPSPSPSPTCTPAPTGSPSPSPSSSGTNTPNGAASAADTPASSASADPAATGTASPGATGTPTPTPTPTLPPCPS